MVADLTPVLLYFGVPLKSSEGSDLLIALELIAKEVSVEGDPRNEIRRLSKINRKINYEKKLGRASLAETFEKAIHP